jgi:hypothetical protein
MCKSTYEQRQAALCICFAIGFISTTAVCIALWNIFKSGSVWHKIRTLFTVYILHISTSVECKYHLLVVCKEKETKTLTLTLIVTLTLTSTLTPTKALTLTLILTQVNILLSDLLQAAAGTLFLLMMVLSPLQLNDDEDEQFCDPSNHGTCITCLFFPCVIDV